MTYLLAPEDYDGDQAEFCDDCGAEQYECECDEPDYGYWSGRER